MNNSAFNQLPMGPAPAPLAFPHFPTRQQAFVWRNWGCVPLERLARVLRATAADVQALAEGMGLAADPEVSPRWLERSYITLIRNNWHLLPYEQLLELLDWTPEHMDFLLLEEDFLWGKLGNLKPKVEPIIYAPLTPEETRKTARLKEIWQKYSASIAWPPARPFGFIPGFRKIAPSRPHLQSSAVERKSRFDLRMIYPYYLLYGDPLNDPEFFELPEELFNQYSRLGINAVWIQAVLYKLYPLEKAPEYSVGFEQRLARLRRLAQRAADYGIGLFLYLNEPRGMRAPFFEKYPDWRGVEDNKGERFALCTSRKAVLEYLEQSLAWLFKKAPELAGVFTITRSENHTNCKGRSDFKKACPLCSQRSFEEVIAEVNNTIERGVHRSKPDARVIAWTWSWAPEWEKAAIDLLSDRIELMRVSEWGLPTKVGGIQGEVRDYSISQVGPSAKSRELWEHARKRGLKTVAKVQINNSWECSAVPYLPVPELIQEHLENLSRAGVKGLMLSWTLGGYPSFGLELASQFFFEDGRIVPDILTDFARREFGPAAAPHIREAWRCFSAAFREFPFHISVLYVGPQNMGPANLLFAEPTGYLATMLGFPYDELERWRAIYPEDVFENQWDKLCRGWQAGLKALKKARIFIPENWKNKLESLERVALAAYIFFNSARLQTAFVRLRDQFLKIKEGEAKEKIRLRLCEILSEEISNALIMDRLFSADSTIGFEATNHYAFTPQNLREKVLNCEYLLQQYSGWQV